jgi:hypothetical protein
MNEKTTPRTPLGRQQRTCAGGVVFITSLTEQRPLPGGDCRNRASADSQLVGDFSLR